MTRPEAEAALRRLAHKLEADSRGADRLLERVASHDEREMLRGVLVEAGARALLAELDDAVEAPPEGRAIEERLPESRGAGIVVSAAGAPCSAVRP